MKTRWIPRLAAPMALILTVTLGACGGGTPPSVVPPPQVSLGEAFEQIRDGHGMPALAGAFVMEGKVTQSAVVGVRSVPTAVTATLEDQWHLGSLTKAMTATLTARLVEKGVLQWSTTLGDVLPHLTAQVDPAYSGVTIKELLSHTGGVLSDISRIPGWAGYFSRTEDIQSVRREMVAEILQFPPENARGKFSYSNAGYVVAGAMLETLTSKAWEELMADEVFLPLGIEDAGFGAPGNGIDQPSGHRRQNGQWQAVSPDQPGSDNPKAMGPAGAVHMSLPSLARFVLAHLQGESGNSDLLSADSFATLHQAQGQSGYALGWFREGGSLSHDGSNTMWFAKIGLDIQRGIAAIAVTNAGSDEANVATDDAIKAMLVRNVEP